VGSISMACVNLSLPNSQQVSNTRTRRRKMRPDSSKLRQESKQRGSTHIASSKFFSAMALLPSALSASAMVNSDIEESLECAYLICDLAGTNTPKGVVGIRQPPSISRAFEIPFSGGAWTTPHFSLHRLGHVNRPPF